MAAYYNDIDPYAAQWLCNLIAAGHIAPGDVDERSIVDVQPDDLRGYSQCHFFAGIGGWSLALRMAGWPDDRPVWTGSCPCQPFSGAGQGRATADERHLWPDWFRLVRAVRPPVLLGEQVEAAIGWGWIDLVHADLGAEGYATRFAVLPACGIGAPHIRQRVWFVADTVSAGRAEGRAVAGNGSLASGGTSGLVADADAGGRPLERGGGLLDGERAAQWNDADGRGPSLVGDADDARSQGWRFDLGEHADQRSAWAASDWIDCIDGKARPVEPGTCPLLDGLSFKLGSRSTFEGKSRVGMLRAYGNAIVPPLAAEFIRAYMEC